MRYFIFSWYCAENFGMLYIFDSVNREWTDLSGHLEGFIPIERISATWISFGGDIYLFGGRDYLGS
jgi:hypothetical protein